MFHTTTSLARTKSIQFATKLTQNVLPYTRTASSSTQSSAHHQPIRSFTSKSTLHLLPTPMQNTQQLSLRQTSRFSSPFNLIQSIPRKQLATYTTTAVSLSTIAKFSFVATSSSTVPHYTSQRSVFTLHIDEPTPEVEMSKVPNTVPFTETSVPTVVKTDAEWQKQLTSGEYQVLRHAETEARFKGYTDCTDAGVYVCKGCQTPLFDSSHKFQTECGWPSFDNCLPDAVTTRVDPDGKRIEIVCTACHGHLGHVFSGEKLTDADTRHCVNSCAVSLLHKDSEAIAKQDQ